MHTLRDAARLVDPVLAEPALQALLGLAALDPQQVPAAITAHRILRDLGEPKSPDGSYLQPNPQLRAQILQALVNTNDLDIVLRALLEDVGSVQDLVGGYLDDAKAAGRVTSLAISEALIHIFSENPQYQSAILRSDARDRLVRALRPLPEEGATDPEALPRRLIAAALTARQDERLGKLLADLLDVIVGDKDRAGELINRYQQQNHISDDDLLVLRSQIGGRTTLAPIMRTLEARQIEYFQNPIKYLNDTTQANWLKTIGYAQKGFVVRMIMSVVVFVVGMTLVIASVVEILFGSRSLADLVGPGITLVGGLASMLAVVYSGPLKDIRQSVNDLGVASAIFIGYVHRILEISHTFSYYYLNKEITYEEMTKSSALIAAAMQDIYRMLPHDPLPPDGKEPLPLPTPDGGAGTAGGSSGPPPALTAEVPPAAPPAAPTITPFPQPRTGSADPQPDQV
jgi:hypothetical protein